MTMGALIIAVVAAVLALILMFEVLRLRKIVMLVPKDGGVLESLRQIDDALRVVEDEMETLQPRVEALEGRVPLAISRTGVVAYDAFDDIAGNLSRSIALLNEIGDGFVISLLVGRAETRFFSKQVRALAGAEPLSPEEQQAIRQAVAAG